MRFLSILFSYLALASTATAQVQRLAARDFLQVERIVMGAVEEHGAGSTLFIPDNDNTMTRNPHILGSDAWYAWQKSLPPGDEGKVSQDDAAIVRRLQQLYEIGRLELADPHVAEVIHRFQARFPQMGQMVLTSRGGVKRDILKITLAENSLDFGPGAFGTDQIDFKLPEDESKWGGLTREQLVAWKAIKKSADGRWEFVSPVTYHNGMLMTGWTHKGAAARIFLAQYPRTFKSIVFVDDLETNVEKIVEAFQGVKDLDLRAVHYRNEEGAVKAFNTSNKKEAIDAYNLLDETIHRYFGEGDTGWDEAAATARDLRTTGRSPRTFGELILTAYRNTGSLQQVHGVLLFAKSRPVFFAKAFFKMTETPGGGRIEFSPNGFAIHRRTMARLRAKAKGEIEIPGRMRRLKRIERTRFK